MLNNNPYVNIFSDWQINVAKGGLDGYNSFDVFGHNRDVSVGTEAVWDFGGIWSPMTGSAAKLWVSSSNSNDTVSGSGARTIKISGVGPNRKSQSEILALSGSILVTSSLTWLGINQVLVNSVGTTGSANLGGITLIEQSGSTVQAFISGSDGISQQMIYHVPTGQTLYLKRFLAGVQKISGSNQQPVVQITGYVVFPNNVKIEIYNDFFDPTSKPLTDSNRYSYSPIPGGSYMWLQATTDQNNTYVRARVEGTSIDD